MPDEAPPPKKYGFKPRAFERVNQPTTEGTALGVDDFLKAAATARPRPAAAVKSAPENEVHAILRQNVKKAGSQYELIAMPTTRSRRHRDFWLLFILGNGGLGTVFGFALKNHDLFVAGFTGAGLIIYTIGLSWIVWGVMDRY